MTNSEFSNQFDVLYNNIMSNQAPGLDEYEKSVFLTKAQDEIVKAYFNPKGNKFLEGFDGNEQRQIDFSMLMKTSIVESSAFGDPQFDLRDDGIKSVPIPPDVLSFVNEKLQVTRSNQAVVLAIIPISYTEYTLKMSKPYKRPLNYQAWRLIDNTSGTSRKADVIAGPNDTLVRYIARYVKKPTPIILAPLEGISIGGYLGTGQTSDGQGGTITVLVPANNPDSITVTAGIECELDPILHEDILQRAVELAKAAYTGDLTSQLALGQSSETNKGVVAAPSR